MKLRAQRLAHRGRDRRQFLRELVERVAQAVAQTRPRKQGPHTLHGAVEAIDQDPFDSIRGLLLGCGALELLIRLGKGCRTGVLSIPQMPDDTATDNRGQIHLLGKTVAVLLIGQEIDGQGQTTPGQDRHETVLTEGAHQAIEGHRGDMADHRGQLQTETTMGGQQGIAGHLRMYLAVTQDEVGQDGEHCTTRGALETPEGDPAQTDPEGMRVACQAPTSLTSRLVFELKAKGEEKGEDAFDKRFAIAKQLIIGRFVLQVDGNGPVFAGLAGGVAHGSSSGQMVGVADDPKWRNACPIARGWGRRRGVTTKLDGMWIIYQYLCQLRKAEGGLRGMNTAQAGDLVENLA